MSKRDPGDPKKAIDLDFSRTIIKKKAGLIPETTVEDIR